MEHLIILVACWIVVVAGAWLFVGVLIGVFQGIRQYRSERYGRYLLPKRKDYFKN